MANDKINNIDRARQQHLFEGMNLMRNIVPTDVDIFIEYGGRLFIFGEGKYMDNEMPIAQRMAFEGLCSAMSELQNYVMWVLLYRHEVHDTNEPVLVKDQFVTEIYSSLDLRWKKPTDVDVIPKFKTVDGKITMQQAIKQIENWCIENCKFNI